MTCGRKVGPYDCCTVVCGDCLELMKALPDGCVDAVITDPVWPNTSVALPGASDPFGLFAGAAEHFPRLTKRLVVHLGQDSDPRFLLSVPAAMPFFSVLFLEYACPTRKGRLLYNGDVAYAFGSPVSSREHFRIISAKYVSTRPDAERTKLTAHKEYGKPVEGLHPCPRRVQHVEWLVSRHSEPDGLVCDPFLGSGTTAVAAKKLDRHFLGFEISEEYCRIARERIALVEAQPNLFEKPAEQLVLPE